MRPDKQAQALLKRLEQEAIPPLSGLTPVEARRINREGDRKLEGPSETVALVKNLAVPGPSGHIPIRIYVPLENERLPILVYFHGGGWVVGDLDSVDCLCRSIANSAKCMVASVDYCLAPEHKFPAPLEDSYGATKWISDHAADLNGDSRRIAVAGDSAGGNLAAAVSLMARDRGGPAIIYQLLIYPITNHRFDTDSYKEYGDGYYLTKEDMKWFWNHYLRNERSGEIPYASPLLANNLSSLPPAFVMTAEFDPLRDEGEAYAARLQEFGVPVKVTRYSGTIHGFITIAELPQSKLAIEDATIEIRRVFGNS